MPEITKYWNDTAWNRDHESLKVGVVSNHYLGGDVVTIDCSTTDMGGETWTTKLRFPREEFKEFLAMCMLRVLTTGGDDDDQTQSGPEFLGGVWPGDRSPYTRD